MIYSLSFLPEVEEDAVKGYRWYEEKAAGFLIGENILGRLLMEVREELKSNQSSLDILKPSKIKNFLLLKSEILLIYAQKEASRIAENRTQQPSLSFIAKDIT